MVKTPCAPRAVSETMHAPPSRTAAHATRPAMKRLRDASMAVLALVVFVGGMVVAPVTHLVGHHNDHQHGPAGPILGHATPMPTCAARDGFARVRVQRAFRHAADLAPDSDTQCAAQDAEPQGHAHHGATHRDHDAPLAPDAPTSAHHGDGALQHFGVALLASALVLTVPFLPVPTAHEATFAAPSEGTIRVLYSPESARAPPA